MGLNFLHSSVINLLHVTNSECGEWWFECG